MFGYITICKEELKIKEYNMYKAYYCGLCKALGKNYSQAMRLGLSYDLTFLAMLMDSIATENVEVESERCLKHIGAKQNVVKNSDALIFCSDINVLLTYYKLLDDIKDSFPLKALTLIIPYILPAKKARKRQSYLAGRIKRHLNELAKVEKSGTDDTDLAAHHFACLLEDIFAGDDNLRKLGYNLGRFIYLIDALDDYEKDLKSGNYNPLVKKFGNDFKGAKEFAEQSLIYTLSCGASEYEKLNILKNKEILDNIIYFGLKQRLYTVLKGKNNEKSI